LLLLIIIKSLINKFPTYYSFLNNSLIIINITIGHNKINKNIS
jgi:hypothetical protein